MQWLVPFCYINKLNLFGCLYAMVSLLLDVFFFFLLEVCRISGIGAVNNDWKYETSILRTALH